MSRAPSSASSAASSSPSSSPRAKYLRTPDPVPQTVNPTECARIRRGDERAVELLNEVLVRRGTSNVELAEVIGCPERTVRAIRSRDRRKPLKVGHLYAIDERTALAYLDAIRVDILTRRSHGG